MATQRSTAGASGEAFERGRVVGEINARLAGHDAHLATINGSVARFVVEMHALTVVVQRVADQQHEAANVAIATAAALTRDTDARRAASELAWRPWVRLFAALAALGSIVSIVAVYLSAMAKL